MRLLQIAFLVSLGFGCGQGAPARDDVSSARSAVTARPPVKLTPFVPDGGVAWPPGAQEQRLAIPAFDGDYRNRQQQYLEALGAKEAEWRAEGRTPTEVARLQGELKRVMLGR